jgi:DNA polymerase-3 subunit delta'
MSLPWLQDSQRQFNQQLLAGRQAHAVLLTGPAGLGKLQLAREMAATLLCLQPLQEELPAQPGLACGQCRSCQLFRGGAHPDFRLVTFIKKEKSEDLKTVIGVDQVRELIASMQLTNGLSPRKVALVHPAEALNRNAANAILKTLEEPPGELVLLLVSNDASRLPATIRSRCQVLHVRPPRPAEAQKWLQQCAGVSPAEATLALQAAANSPLQAALLLQQGRVDEYRMVLGHLQKISSDSEQTIAAYDQLFKLDQHELWHWLAVASAEKLRSSLAAASGQDLPSGGASQRHWLGLYQLANRNRLLLSTSVRKDLLLRDWLIQWTASTSS